MNCEWCQMCERGERKIPRRTSLLCLEHGLLMSVLQNAELPPQIQGSVRIAMVKESAEMAIARAFEIYHTLSTGQVV